MLALSTSYFTLRNTELSGEALVQASLALGFHALEVDYRVTDRQFRGLSPIVARGGVTVVSVHHPLPRDPRISPFKAHEDRPSLASLDRGERADAVRLGVETLARAEYLGAGAAVFHVGAVALDEGLDPRELNRWVRDGRRDSPEYEELRQRVAASRLARAQPHVEALLSSLDRLAAEAFRRGVTLAIENRYHPEQIPTVEELEKILQTFAGAPLAYWHDTGHAESLVTLGFLDSQTAPLEAFRGHTAGFHLHDAKGLDDHRAPGEGDLNFSVFAPFVTPTTRLVLEPHPPSPPEAVARAVAWLSEAGIAVGS